MKQSGFSVMELIVGVAIAVIVSGVTASLFSIIAKQTRSAKILMARDQLRTRLEKNMNEKAALTESAANPTLSSGNLILSYCLNGSPIGCAGHPNCCVAGIQDFVMRDPDFPGVNVGGMVTGPALYSEDGSPCTGPKCIMQVITSFRATCKGSAISCQKAERIDLHYSLEPTAFVALNATDLPGIKAYKSSAVVQSREAISGFFSEDCTDWAAKGWPSEQDCLADGRKHKILETDNLGNITAGSVAAIQTAILNGAKFTVRSSFFGAEGYAECRSVYIHLGNAYCTTVFSWARHDPPWTYGVARYSTSGEVNCTSWGVPGDACAATIAPQSWYITY